MGRSDPKRDFPHIIALVVTGFGIGWLAGLLVSPVVSIVMTTVTGLSGWG